MYRLHKYLDAEFKWLRIYVNLLEARKHLNEVQSGTSDNRGSRVGAVTMVPSKELARQVSELQAQENDLRSNLEKRLQTHREHGDFALGLDCICESYNLSVEERRILLALTLPAISVSQACDIFAPYNLYNGTIAVQDLMALLRPSGAEDFLWHRKLFLAGAPLVKENLITMDYPSHIDYPSAILNADVALTMSAFSTIVGIPELASDAEVAADKDEG